MPTLKVDRPGRAAKAEARRRDGCHGASQRLGAGRRAAVWSASALGTCLLAIGLPGHAVETVGADGFSMCSIANSDIGQCEPLTEATLNSHGLSTSERSIVDKLRRLADGPDESLLDDIAKSFAPIEQPVATADFSDVWFPDRDAAGNPQTNCLICGLHLRLAKDDLVQITYAPKARFIVIWNRGLTTEP